MDEYISKQSVIDYLNGYLNSIGECGADTLLFYRGQRRALINSIQDISAIKATDVQPVKHGRWIFQNRNDEDGRHIYHCSECNFETKVFPCNLIPWQMHEKYCARCGARMDGDSE